MKNQSFLSWLAMGIFVPLYLASNTPVHSQDARENEKAGLIYSKYPSRFNSSNPLTQNSELLLRFNAPVDPDQAAQHFTFYDKEKKIRMAVEAVRPTVEQIAQFRGNLTPDAKKALVLNDYLLIKPAAPLPLDANYYLILKKGLEGGDGSHMVHEDRSDYVGRLSRFLISSISTRNNYDSDMFITVNHNKHSLNPVFDKERLRQFIAISPEPENFAVEPVNGSFRLEGKFEYGVSYSVSVQPGIIANDKTQLLQSFSENVTFEPNDGFVTLPAFSATQTATGHRKFEIRTGNLEALHVRVKSLEGQNLIYALQGYDDAYEGWGDDRKIPFTIVPGKIVHDKMVERTAEIDTTETIQFNWDDWSAGKKFGAFYLCAEGRSDTPSGVSVGAQALVQLTDIGLAWKQNEKETIMFAFSLESGKPLPGVSLQLYSENADSLDRVTTNEDGIGVFPSDTYIGKAAWLDASHGEDRHVMRFSKELNTMGLWSFSIPYRYDPPLEGERRTLVFTDRGVYKPGEEVHLKVISRLIDADHLLPVSGGKAKLTVQDSRDRTIVEKDVELTERGTLDETFTLPASGLGYHTVEIDFNGELGEDEYPDWRKISNHSFRVEEYRVNTFEVKLGARDSYTDGEPIDVALSANYYMGKPLSKSLVSWSAFASPSFPRPRGFDDFDFGDITRDESTFSENDEMHLSEDGTGTITVELPEQPDIPSPRRVRVTAEITDVNQQTISTGESFTVQSSDFYLGVRTPEGVHRAGDTIPLAIASVTSDGEIYTEPVETGVTVAKVEYNTVKVQGAGGKITYRNERNLVEISKKNVEMQTGIEPKTGLARTFSHDITFQEAGEYVVSFDAEDQQGRKIVTRTKVRIIGAEEPSWSWHDVVRIDVIPDKDSYKKGDTAKLLVRTPVFGNALITTERGGVRDMWTQDITEHETVLEVPIGQEDAPNLFASVLIIRGSDESPHIHASTDYRMGYCKIDVEDPDGHLAIDIDTGDAEYYQPGEEVKVNALVSNAAGEPVTGAEVTLYAVDEGVLSLTGYRTPDPADVFFEAFPLNVWTGQSISSLLPENPLEQDFGNKGYVIGGGGAADGLDPNRIRKDFKAVAFWEGAVLTGDDGKVAVTFKAPDNLTTFRVMAVVSEGNRFGHADAPLTVNKPLIIEPALPGFSNVTDQVDLSAVLHNNTKVDQEVEVEVQLDEHAIFIEKIGETIPTSLDLSEETTKRIRKLSLKAGATETLRLPVVVRKTGEAKWNWKVRSLTDTKLVDATESTLEVGYPLPLLRESKRFAIRNEQELQNLLDSVNPRLLNGHGSVNLKLSNSRMIEAADAIDYLLKYPYGCVEQTTSSTLPWLSTQRMRHSLPGLDKSDEEIAKAIEKGVERLFAMQTNDGGLGYWPGASQSVLWGSAYGGMAIALAEKQGMEVPAEQSQALWNYLSKHLRSSADLKEPYDLSQRCLAAYTLALAGRAEASYHDVLYQKRDELPAEGRSLLALAMMETGALDQPQVKPRVIDLLQEPEEDILSAVSWYGKPYRTATRLLAFSRYREDVETADALVEDLMKQLLPSRGWGSTYSNAWPLVALSAYNDTMSSSLAPNGIELQFGDTSEKIELAAEASLGEISFPFEGDVRKQPLSLKLSNSAPVFAHLEVATQPELIPLQPENKGFGIQRTYFKVDNDGAIKAATNLMVGDLILVKLDINVPKERESYIAIDDPLPAILEAVNPNFKTSGSKNVREKSDSRRLYTNHNELQKDRAVFFADSVFRAGDYQIQYLARVVSPGNVIAPPAKIEAMYEPQRFGLSGTQQIWARPLDLGANKVAAR